jgi:hypothetical protein
MQTTDLFGSLVRRLLKPEGLAGRPPVEGLQHGSSSKTFSC